MTNVFCTGLHAGKAQQTFSIEGQIVNISGFGGWAISVPTTDLCCYSVESSQGKCVSDTCGCSVFIYSVVFSLLGIIPGPLALCLDLHPSSVLGDLTLRSQCSDPACYGCLSGPYVVLGCWCPKWPAQHLQHSECLVNR
jgi:hypothetical protein